MPRASPRERIAPIRLPLCDTRPRRPAVIFGMSSTALTVKATPRGGTIVPMEFGPITREPAARAMSTIRCCRFAPSGPDSAKPSL